MWTTAHWTLGDTALMWELALIRERLSLYLRIVRVRSADSNRRKMRVGRFTGFEVSLRAGYRLDSVQHARAVEWSDSRDKARFDRDHYPGADGQCCPVLVFTGSGLAFMPPIPPGHDSDIGTYEGLRHLSQTLNLAIRNCDKIAIAALNGVAIQTGMTMALACDFRVAAKSQVGRATLRFGLLPDEGGQYLCVQLMGVAKSMDFFINKRIVDAEQALELGLVHEVVDDADLESRAMAMATDIANGPQVAQRLLKRSVYNAADMIFEQSLDEIAAKTAISDHHEDARKVRWR